jgi:hypothetical protein
MDENRVPHLFRTIPSDALTDLHRKRFRANVQLAGVTGVAVDLELAVVLDTKHIQFIFHEYPQPSPCHFSLPFWMRTRTSNLVFQQTVN